MDWLERTSVRREFEDFVTAASSSLLRTAYLVTWDVGRAEDLVQEALLRAARQWPRLRGMAHPEAYVRRIVVNLALDQRRRRWRQAEELHPSGAPGEEAGDDRTAEAFGAVDDRGELIGLIGALPPRQRVVLVLRFYEDMSEAETAAVLGWPVGTVKSTAARALRRLQDAAQRRSGSRAVRAAASEGGFGA